MSLPRRTFLRGSGIAISLPMLDAMIPALDRSAKGYETPAGLPRRMIAIQTNMGILSQHFFPTVSGKDFELTPYLEVLKDFKSKMTVFSGVSHPDVDGAHEAERSFLSAAPHQAELDSGIRFLSTSWPLSSLDRLHVFRRWFLM